MYIRWITRGHKSDVADVTFHDAYLVESYRNEEGSPRQRMVMYLGNLRQLGEALPGIERELFLLRAEQALAYVKELSPFERDGLMGQLHERVPPLTKTEMREGFHNTLRWYYNWWADHSTPPSKEEMYRLVDQMIDDVGE